MKQPYPAESAGSVMTRAVPTCTLTSTRQHVFDMLLSNIWEDEHCRDEQPRD